MTGGTLPPITPGHMPRIRDEILRSNLEVRRAVVDDAAAGYKRTGEIDPMLSRALDGVDALARRAEFMDLFLTTVDMTPVAVDAARDLPEQVIAQHRPAATGMLAFSGGLPPMPHPRMPNLQIQPEVITWTQGDAPLDDSEPVVAHFAAWCRSGQIPTLQGAQNVPRWVRVMSSEIPLNEVFEWADYKPETVNLVSLTLATWILMDTPTVAEPRVSMETGPRGKSGKRPLPRQIRTVDLRRLARKPSPEPDDEDAGPGRVYRHQWVVRGHWRNQAHGPERKDRRATWVPSYLKGPEGAPFLPSETVFVWRR